MRGSTFQRHRTVRLYRIARLLFYVMLVVGMAYPFSNTNRYEVTGALVDLCAPLLSWEGRITQFLAESGTVVFMAWTTGRRTWQDRHWSAVESVFIHHPRACISLVSTSLDNTFFEPLSRRGYCVDVIQITPQLASSCGFYAGPFSKHWLFHISILKGKYFYTHWTDYLRYVLLNRYGGIYLDADAVILQPLPLQGSYVGRDHVNVHRCSWCPQDVLTLRNYYIAPGVIISEKGVFSSLIEKTFCVKTYNSSCFNCVGPLAFTNFILRDGARFEVVPEYYFYPLDYEDIPAVFAQSREASNTAQILRYVSLSLHLYGRVTRKLTIHRRSVLHQIFQLQSFIRPKSVSTFWCRVQDQMCQGISRYHAEVKIKSFGPIIYSHGKDKIFTGPSALIVTSSHVGNFEMVSIEVLVSDDFHDCGKLFTRDKPAVHSRKINMNLSNATLAEINAFISEVGYHPAISNKACDGGFKTAVLISLTIRNQGRESTLVEKVPLVVLKFAAEIHLRMESETEAQCDKLKTFHLKLKKYFPDVTIIIPHLKSTARRNTASHCDPSLASPAGRIPGLERAPFVVVIDQFISLNLKPRLELLLVLALSRPESVVGATSSTLRPSQLFMHKACHETKMLPSLYISNATKYHANSHVRRSRSLWAKEHKHIFDCPALRFGES